MSKKPDIAEDMILIVSPAVGDPQDIPADTDKTDQDRGPTFNVEDMGPDLGPPVPGIMIPEEFALAAVSAPYYLFSSYRKKQGRAHEHWYPLNPVARQMLGPSASQVISDVITKLTGSLAVTYPPGAVLLTGMIGLFALNLGIDYLKSPQKQDRQQPEETPGNIEGEEVLNVELPGLSANG
jgi:hypothetical protein